MTETTASQTRRTLPVIWKGAGAAALLLGLALPGEAGTPPGHQPTLITFDVPGMATSPNAINPGGVITGTCWDANGTHGFLRSPDGTVTTFDVPGSSSTHPTSITTSGAITGWVIIGSDADYNSYQGFVRALDGSITTFNAPQGCAIFGSFAGQVAPPPSINEHGDIAGTIYCDDGSAHGFLRTPDGTFTTLDFPYHGGGGFTEAFAINPAGVIVGDYGDDISSFTGFVRSPDGVSTRIDYPGCTLANQQTGAVAINPDGVVVGICGCGDLGHNRNVSGYVRTPDGNVTVFDPPGATGATYTSPAAINPAGTVTGYYWDGVHQWGFVRRLDGAITQFLGPENSNGFIAPTAINPAGVVTGWFYGTNLASHGFLWIP